MPGGDGAEDRGHRAVGREQLAHVADRGVRRVALGEYGPCACPDEPGAVVVDAFLGLRERPLRQPGLGVPRRVAQVIEQDDGARRQADVRPDVVLAVVHDLGAVGARRGVEAQAVLRLHLERRVDAGPAVAVAEVHEHVCALHRCLDLRPGRVGREQLGDVARVALRLGDDVVRVGLVVRVVVAHGPHDDHDLGLRRGRDGRGGEGERREQGDDDGDEGAMHQVGSCRAEGTTLLRSSRLARSRNTT